MIRVNRGTEPNSLKAVRIERLHHLRTLGREPTSDEIDGYRVVARELWISHYHKCCYCEHRLGEFFNDVEHYRPKTSANREPGSKQTHGYWWLAYTWSNLLYSCPTCNRRHKKCSFPLASGCTPLIPELGPPGKESPLLIDPSATNPVPHIVFVLKDGYWKARPRNDSPLGSITIDVCGLNDGSHLELREDHYQTVILPQIQALRVALEGRSYNRVIWEFERARDMLRPRQEYVALTYDVFRHSVPSSDLARWGKRWPPPSRIPLPVRR